MPITSHHGGVRVFGGGASDADSAFTDGGRDGAATAVNSESPVGGAVAALGISGTWDATAGGPVTARGAPGAEVSRSTVSILGRVVAVIVSRNTCGDLGAIAIL